jgi:hypothetical protein
MAYKEAMLARSHYTVSKQSPLMILLSGRVAERSEAYIGPVMIDASSEVVAQEVIIHRQKDSAHHLGKSWESLPRAVCPEDLGSVG